MAGIDLKVPIQVNLPDDWIEQIVNRLMNDPEAEWVEIVRCKDCKYVGTDATCCLVCDREGMGLKPYHVRKDDYCSYAERRPNGSD